MERATACNDMVVKIWSSVLCRVVLGVVQVRRGGCGAVPARAPPPPPMGCHCKALCSL